ncbi:Smc Chromosome segregation ATPases [Rhabdaerophilaceae bacterium]
MKFERLRLTGFKTFVDQTELLIAPGLTGIVGPNGCGKSNLVEALRWAMGETSSKSLRGGEMDDVIFAGAGSRSERNHAEVSIRLTDPPKDLTGHLAHAEVLEISRKIIRQQGSSFRINGREVRARDVQILFADAASGARSPSLVRQGQISEIINAKPQHRRRILEDAAGTAGLHARRHEAELRLRQAEENLARAEDVLTELDRQAGDLKKQARQAERYRVLAADIRTLDLMMLAASHQRAFNDARSASEAHQGAIREVATAMVAQGETERERAVAAHELEQSRALAAKARQDHQALLVSREALDGALARVETRLADIVRRRSELDRDQEAAQRVFGDAEAALAALGAENAENVASVLGCEAEQDVARSGLGATEARRLQLESELTNLNSARAEAAANRRAGEAALVGAEQRSERLKAGELEAAQALEALAMSQAQLAGYLGMQSDLEQLEDALAAAVLRAEAQEAKSRTMRDSEQAARPRLAEAERLLQRLDTESRTIRKLVDQIEPGLWTPAIDQIMVEPGYEIALAAALGEDLDAAIEWGAPRHWSSRAMDGEQALPTGSRPLIEVVKAPAPLHLRLRQIGICLRDEGPSLQARLAPGQRLVSREGDLWRWDGYSARGDAPSTAARRLAERNRLSEVEREAREARAKRDLARDAMDQAMRESRRAQEAEARARDDVKKAIRARDEANAVLQREMRRTEETRLRLETARLRLDTLRGDREAAEIDFQNASKALLAMPATTLEDPAILQLTAALSEARKAENGSRSALGALAATLAGLQQRRIAIARDEAAWRARTERAQSTVAEQASRRARLEDEFRSLEGEPATLSLRRRAILLDIESGEAARHTAEEALAAAETHFRRAEDAARSAASQLSAAREMAGRLEVARDHADQRLIHVVATIEGELDAPIATLADRLVVDDRLAKLTPDELEARLRDLRQDRDRLGAVNLRADTELADIEARHADLTRERGEITEAIRKFRRAIDSLNTEGRARLRTAFDAVQGHFERLFQRLFGGGTAELHLIEADDPLEAGLEIIAKPPGKKPQLLSLLSGGEQALTATALIFAVFLTNPAPICVLDEVDAPLDDSNVERLCALLKDIAAETGTRFLVITHNPISMAEMDRLFGVTMAERGVSQLVSVDLTTAALLAEVG